MKLRTLVVTIVVLALLSGIVAFLGRRTAPASTDPRVGQPLLDRAVVEKAGRLRLSDQGKTVTLARQADGTWRVSSYFDLPADFQKLSRFVDDLNEAKLQRLVTSNPERIARLEFKDTKVEFLDNAEKELWAVTLGKAGETGGRFVRFGAEPKAYLASLNAWLDADAKNWANAQLLNLKPDDIARVEFSLPGAAADNPPAVATPIVVSRAKKDDAWAASQTPAGQKLKSDRIASLLSSLTALRFTDTLEPADPKVAAAKAHERQYKLTTFDGKTYSVVIAQKPEEKKLKPPTPAADGKSGPSALGKVSDLAKSEPAKPTANAPGQTAPAGPQPLAPEFETIPAGPAFAFISSSDPTAPVNAMMQKRAFQIGEYAVTSLPQTVADVFEPAPAPAPVPPPAATPNAVPGAKPASPASAVPPAK
jgi:hypothetical protein